MIRINLTKIGISFGTGAPLIPAKNLIINLPEFTQFVQLMYWQKNSCKFVWKIAQSISKRITCKMLKYWTFSFTLLSKACVHSSWSSKKMTQKGEDGKTSQIIMLIKWGA